jgi:hypothetical protein
LPSEAEKAKALCGLGGGVAEAEKVKRLLDPGVRITDEVGMAVSDTKLKSGIVDGVRGLGGHPFELSRDGVVECAVDVPVEAALE